MKLERSKNAMRNIKMGVLSKVVATICPFVLRTIFIHTLGNEYLGLNGLFSSVLSVLSLAELGFGSALVYHMYQAIAGDDHEKINALLHYYRGVYRVVGCVIFAVGCALIPFLPRLIHGTYPSDINPTVVYLLFLTDTCMSYFLAAYRGSLLNAFQRTDILAKIRMWVQIGLSLTQMVVLLVVRNYYAYLVLAPVFAVFSNLGVAVYTRRMFPRYQPVGRLSKEIRQDIREKVSSLMLTKFCQVSRNSFDNIFISLFLGLKEIALYNNYFFIMKSVTDLMCIGVNAITAGIGNSLSSESEEKNHRDMMRINFVYMWIAAVCSACLLCLYQPFMAIWAGADSMLPFSSVILLCLYFYLLKIGDVRGTYAAGAGLWTQERAAVVAELVMNVVLNAGLGYFFGINGIISATLISMFFINFCWKTRIVYQHCFKSYRVGDYFRFHFRYACASVLVCGVTYVVCASFPDSLWFFPVRAAVCGVLPNVLLYLIFRRTQAYKDAMPWLLERLRAHL